MTQAETLIARYIEQGAFAGAALLVTKNGETVHEHYAGQAAPGLPSGPDVMWPLASISKVYSVAMVMKLVELGELTLTQFARQVLPEFTGDGRELVMLRHLLTHTSGLIYESPEMEARLAAQVPMADLIAEAYQAPLLFKPGSSISYADYNTLLAGHMAATVMGKPFAQLVEELVLQPMGLVDTSIRPGADLAPRIAHVRAVMADGTPGAMYNSAHARSLAHPAFGVVASARDMMHFLRHFAPGGPRVHADATVRAMIVDQAGGVRGTHVSVSGLSPHAPVPWGLGWMLQTATAPAVFSDLASHRTFGHGGASGCWSFVDPETNIAVVLLTNTHLRTGRDAWSARLKSISNAAYAAAAG